MKAHEVFNEVMRLGLSPVVLTGRTDSVKASLTQFLMKGYCADQYTIYDSLTSSTADGFIRELSLRKTPTLFTIVDARGVTGRAWQKILKALEDNEPSSAILFLTNGDIPKAIETRCFRCHIPALSEPADYTGTGAFAVGSWITSVDFRNREQLLKSCQGWTPDYTDLLISELGGIITGNSMLKVPVVRLGNERIIYAINSLSKYRDVPTAAVSTGLRLIS